MRNPASIGRRVQELHQALDGCMYADRPRLRVRLRPYLSRGEAAALATPPGSIPPRSRYPQIRSPGARGPGAGDPGGVPARRATCRGAPQARAPERPADHGAVRGHRGGVDPSSGRGRVRGNGLRQVHTTPQTVPGRGPRRPGYDRPHPAAAHRGAQPGGACRARARQRRSATRWATRSVSATRSGPTPTSSS